MLVLFIFLSLVTIDQLSKFIILKNFLPGQSLPVIKDIFHLSLVCNKGVAFGIFSERECVFVWILVICILIIGFIYSVYKRTFSQGTPAKFYLTLILAGAVANLIDRIRLGCVVDFLDFRIWPVFNLADVAITIGTALLILRIFKHQTSNFKLSTLN